MPIFETSFQVNAPLDVVTAFHHDTRTLRLLTPPPVYVQLHRVDPLAEGSISIFTMWFGPIPIRWKAVHSQVDPRSGFTDTQAEGPLLRWTHRHTWKSLDDKTTLMTEHIDYQHHPGLKGWLTRILFSTTGLKAMFFYRKLATQHGVKRLLQSPEYNRKP